MRRRTPPLALVLGLVAVSASSLALAQETVESSPAPSSPVEGEAVAPTEPSTERDDDGGKTDEDEASTPDDAKSEEAPPTDEKDPVAAAAGEAAEATDAAVEGAAAVVDDAAAIVDGATDVVLLEEEDLPKAEKDAKARFDAAKKAAEDVDAAAKVKELTDAEAALKLILDKRRKDGFWWDKALTLGATGIGLYNQKVVGQADGFSLQAGALVNGLVTLGYGGNEWTNTLLLEESVLATPTDELFAPRVTKAADSLALVSAYKFRWVRFPYVGPYAQVMGQTQVFQSALTPGVDGVVARRTFRDGRVQDEAVPVGKSAFLTDFFEPLTLTESAGLFVDPPPFPPWFASSFKVGAAVQHVLARDGFIVADDPATGSVVELQQLSSSNSAGGEASAALNGTITELFAWALLGRVYYPMFILEETSLDLVERTHVDVQGTLSLRLTKWLSADWVTKVKREPFVLNDWQLQSQVMITSGFSVF